MDGFDVICIGNSAVDVPLRPVGPEIFSHDSYPIDRIIPQVGGSGTNVSTTLSRLGKRVKLVTLLGNDMLGDYLVRHCATNGIDTSAILRSSAVDTPLSIGLVREDGERSFVVSRSSSTFAFCADHVDPAVFAGARMLMFSSIFIMPEFDDAGLTRIFRAAREAGLIVCADMMRSRTGQRMDAIASALPYVDYFFANFEEAAFLTSQPTLNAMGKALLDAGVGHVLIKNGKEGCYICDNETACILPAFRNEHPVDTIGAGDNFAAGFLSSVLDGASFPQAARFANATAAISVGAPGATNGVQSKPQVEAFLQKEDSLHTSAPG